jgi:hypothetical protein
MKVRTKHNVLERPFCLDRARAAAGSAASSLSLAVFSSKVGSTELDLRATVFLPEKRRLRVD